MQLEQRIFLVEKVHYIGDSYSVNLDCNLDDGNIFSDLFSMVTSRSLAGILKHVG